MVFQLLVQLLLHGMDSPFAPLQTLPARPQKRHQVVPQVPSHAVVEASAAPPLIVIPMTQRENQSSVWSAVGMTIVLPVAPSRARFSDMSMVDGLMPVECPSVMLSMDPRPVSPLTARIGMLAPSAGTDSTTCRTALLDQYFPVTTPLNVPNWVKVLNEIGAADQFSHVLHGLQFGFSLGLEAFTLSETFSPPNHYCSSEHHKFVIDKYAKECSLGRVSPGYPPSLIHSLFGHYCTALLNVIKSSRGKLRITVDHSYPRNNPSIQSINSVIDAKRFQCEWGSFSACWLLVADAPLHMQVAVFDVESAFQIIPTCPEDRLFTALLIDNKVVFDHRLNFGISPAPGIFGWVADAMVHIYRAKGVEAVLK